MLAEDVGAVWLVPTVVPPELVVGGGVGALVAEDGSLFGMDPAPVLAEDVSAVCPVSTGVPPELVVGGGAAAAEMAAAMMSLSETSKNSLHIHP